MAGITSRIRKSDGKQGRSRSESVRLGQTQSNHRWSIGEKADKPDGDAYVKRESAAIHGAPRPEGDLPAPKKVGGIRVNQTKSNRPFRIMSQGVSELMNPNRTRRCYECVIYRSGCRGRAGRIRSNPTKSDQTSPSPCPLPLERVSIGAALDVQGGVAGMGGQTQSNSVKPGGLTASPYASQVRTCLFFGDGRSNFRWRRAFRGDIAGARPVPMAPWPLLC